MKIKQKMEKMGKNCSKFEKANSCITKRTYFIRRFIETPNSISSRKEIETRNFKIWKFKFKSGELILYDSKYGLFTDSYIKASSSDNAEHLSKTYTENLVSLIDFITASSSPSSRLILLYESSENLLKRDFKQIFHKLLKERNIKEIDQKAFKDLFLALDKNLDPRLFRALGWRRKANLQKIPIDKFISYWTGLESISSLLFDHYKIPEEERAFKCKNCGQFIFPSSLKGVKKLFLNEIKDDKQLYYKIRDTRNKIIHGLVQLDEEFIKKIEKYNPFVKKALIIGIGKLIPISDDITGKITEQKHIKYHERLRYVVKAKLTNFFPPKIGDISKQPYFSLEKDVQKDRYLDEKNKLHLIFNPELKAHNANFEKPEIFIYGDVDSAIENVAFLNEN